MTWSDAQGTHRGPPRGRTPPRALLPAVVGLIQVIGTYWASHHDSGPRGHDALAVLILAASAACLLWKRDHPEIVLFAVVGLSALYWNLGYSHGPYFIAELIAFFNAMVRRRWAAAIVAFVIAYPLEVWLPDVLNTRAPLSFGEALGEAAWALALFAGAAFFSTRRAAMIEGAKRRSEERKRRASEERMEIARELHDVLAHNISLINVQANVGLHLMDEKPDQARTALGAIKEVSAETLGELRSVLDILRAGGGEAPRSPTSGLAHLDDLLDRTRAGGFEVSRSIEGSERALPPQVDLAAFRIIQEALTNVRRHSNADRAEIILLYGDDVLTVRVDDRGTGGVVPQDSKGRGIEGMRERAQALGGALSAGPLPGAGFRVEARLPLAGGDRK